MRFVRLLARIIAGTLNVDNRYSCSAVVSLRAAICFAALVSVCLPLARAAETDEPANLRSIFSGAVPVNTTDLRAMQSHLQDLSARVVPATVAVQVGPAQGSGVIISPDGYVLTAAHVIMRPKQSATLVMSDGRAVRAETLGVFRTLDAGLLKITDAPKVLDRDTWPFVPMGDSENVKPGQWCLATGHPGGVQAAGTPVVRLGRVLSVSNDSAIDTDCTLIGGDSGGPLFDMEGNVVGVHSRIGGSLTLNLHVPVNVYRGVWERLEAGEAWGYVPGNRPFFGVQGDAGSSVAKVAQVFRGTPAEKAGIEVGDVVTKFAGKEVTDFESLKAMVESQEPGQSVDVELRRDGQRVQFKVVIGRQRE